MDHIPTPPPTQALSSLTFTSPPLDGTLTIAQVYDWHFLNTPNHRLFVYAQADGSTRTIYWPEAVQAIYVGSTILRRRFKWLSGRGPKPVVSILASPGNYEVLFTARPHADWEAPTSDTITYFILIMSCLRANYLVFPISPRLSPPAIAHLLAKAGANYLLICPTTSDLATAAMQTLQDQYPETAAPGVSLIPSFEDLFEHDKVVVPGDIPYVAD
jgi:acyl-CoA synthetase (AMP-forming)/AMP-acid ligase II